MFTSVSLLQLDMMTLRFSWRSNFPVPTSGVPDDLLRYSDANVEGQAPTLQWALGLDQDYLVSDSNLLDHQPYLSSLAAQSHG
jgi:hypothetical protein